MQNLEMKTNSREKFEEAVHTTILPLVVSLGFGDYWKRSQELLEMDRLPVDTLETRQWQAFKSMLEHAYSTVPIYREMMDVSGIKPEDIKTRDDLVRLPTIDKRTVAASFPDRMTSTVSDRSEWRYRSTSGTAFRLMSVTDYATRQWQGGLHLRNMNIASGFEPGKRQVTLRTQACTEACSASVAEEFHSENGTMLPFELEWPPFGFAQLIRQETNLPPLRGRGTLVAPEILDDCLEQIDQLAPYLLRGLPTFLLLLARRLKESGARPPGVQRIVVQDSLAPRVVKREIAEAFGCPVRETFGASELGSMGGECEHGWLHLASDFFLIEILRRDGTAAEPGEPGLVAITSMMNRAMVFMRYLVGDLGRILPGPCECGRNTPRLTIDGRVQESLDADEGFITAEEVTQFLHRFPGVGFFQLIERTPNDVDLLIVPSKTDSLDAEALTRSTERFLGRTRRVKLRTVESILPEESGKFVFVKSLTRDFHPREA